MVCGVFRGRRPQPREAANMSQFGSVTTAPFVAAIRPGALLVALIGSAIALAACARQQDQQQAYIDSLETRIAQLEERLDFTERLLEGRREPPK